MKRIWVLATMFSAITAWSQTADSTKYARCAGSTEMEKCRALVDSMAAETPEAKRARTEKLERERAAAAKAVAQQPLTYKPSAQRVLSDPAVGMNEHDASNTMWGRPETINRTVTRNGTREQWVFGVGRYVYLENGRVTAVSSRH